MTWKCYLCLAMVAGVECFLLSAVGLHQKDFQKVSLFRKSIQSDICTSNGWYRRFAANDNVRPLEELSAGLEEMASRIPGWAITYELDANRMPILSNATDVYPFPLKKSWVLTPENEISTIFLGRDHRFGRVDKGDKPILFETMAFTPEGQSNPYRCATYEEAKKIHEEVCELVEKKKIQYN